MSLPKLPWVTTRGKPIVPELKACLETDWDFRGEELSRLGYTPQRVKWLMEKLIEENAAYGELTWSDHRVIAAYRTDYRKARSRQLERAE